MNEKTGEMKTVNAHEGHRKRLRQRVEENGIETLQSHEVLEYLLFYSIPRRDTNEIAHRLLERFGSLSAVFEASTEELEKVDGISHVSASLLSSMPGIAQKYMTDRWKDRPVLKDTASLGAYLCDLFLGEKNEAFYMLSFDASCKLLKSDIIVRGTISETSVPARTLVEKVLSSNASAVVFSHNHPGGNTIASKADYEVTKSLVALFTSLSIKVIDHIIVSGMRYSSMKMRDGRGQDRMFNLKEVDQDNLNGDWNFDEYYTQD